jgi:Glycosyl transferase family 2
MDLALLSKKILVGLISHNRLNFTLSALETLTYTDVPFDIMIVDNGSEPDTKRKLHEVSLEYGAHFVSIENRNCNGARDMINHYGLTYDYVVYVDNDAIMPKHWLEDLLGFANESGASLMGVSQAEFGGKETFFGNVDIDSPFVVFAETKNHIQVPKMVDWVSGHCLMVEGNFLRCIWTKYKLWERQSLFPIDLDDIDLMMMAKKENVAVYVAPLVIPQNRDFKNEDDSNAYNSVRNDFHNYALSCVSFWDNWGLNPLLNWNKGYSGNVNKAGDIHDANLRYRFLDLVEMLREKDAEIYNGFQEKLKQK